jgi:uncharacterized membrane protein
MKRFHTTRVYFFCREGLKNRRKKISSHLKMKKTVVVSRYNENLDWLHQVQVDDIVIYNKGEILENTISLPNVGRESHTYLHHIINSYDSIEPETIYVFCQGNPFDHARDIVDKINNTGECTRFEMVGDWVIDVIGFYPKHHPSIETQLKQVYDELFLTPRPIKFSFSAGACFMAPGSILLTRTKEFYIQCIKMLETSVNPVEGYVFERLWSLLFNPTIQQRTFQSKNLVIIIASPDTPQRNIYGMSDSLTLMNVPHDIFRKESHAYPYKDNTLYLFLTPDVVSLPKNSVFFVGSELPAPEHIQKTIAVFTTDRKLADHPKIKYMHPRLPYDLLLTPPIQPESQPIDVLYIGNEMEAYQEKLWDHLVFTMKDYKLVANRESGDILHTVLLKTKVLLFLKGCDIEILHFAIALGTCVLIEDDHGINQYGVSSTIQDLPKELTLLIQSPKWRNEVARTSRHLVWREQHDFTLFRTSFLHVLKQIT